MRVTGGHVSAPMEGEPIIIPQQLLGPEREAPLETQLLPEMTP